MRTIEATAVVTPDHTLTVTVPADVPVGPCRVVVVMDRPDIPFTSTSFPDRLVRHDVVLTDPNCTFRREDLYDDYR